MASAPAPAPAQSVPGGDAALDGAGSPGSGDPPFLEADYPHCRIGTRPSIIPTGLYCQDYRMGALLHEFSGQRMWVESRDIWDAEVSLDSRTSKARGKATGVLVAGWAACYLVLIATAPAVPADALAGGAFSGTASADGIRVGLAIPN